MVSKQGPRELKEIEIRFFGFVDEMRESRVKLGVPGEASLGDVLDILFTKHGPKLRQRLLTQDGHLREDVKLVVDGEVIDRLDHKIEGADRVFVVSQFAGG